MTVRMALDAVFGHSGAADAAGHQRSEASSPRDEASDAADALFASVARSGGIVPQLWVYELANVLVLAQRRGRITEAETQRCFGMLDRLALDRVDTPRPAELAAIAAAHALAAHDAAYLHAAMTRSASLATLDERLAAAATRAGVELALSS